MVSRPPGDGVRRGPGREQARGQRAARCAPDDGSSARRMGDRDRKSTRLNSSHDQISYAVFCLKKKKKKKEEIPDGSHQLRAMALTRELDGADNTCVCARPIVCTPPVTHTDVRATRLLVGPHSC